jgi:hypothetical protein
MKTLSYADLDEYIPAEGVVIWHSQQQLNFLKNVPNKVLKESFL